MTTRAPSDPDTAFLLGKIEGQLREVIHNMNNQAMKVDALVSLKDIPDDIREIKDRLTVLETDKHRKDGAVGFGASLFRSPLVGWLVGFGLALYAWLKGHGQ